MALEVSDNSLMALAGIVLLKILTALSFACFLLNHESQILSTAMSGQQ